MAGKLSLLPDKITMTAERFRIELDDEDRRAIAADPRAFLYDLLEKEGAPPPNAVLLGGAADMALTPGFVELIHISSGPFQSYYFWPPPLE